MAELDGRLIDDGGDERERLHERRVPIALHHLGRRRLEPDAELPAHGFFHGGIEMRERADGAGDLADRGLVERAREPLATPAQGAVQHQQLQPERRRLGMDAVGPPDHRRVLVLERARAQRRERAVAAGEQQDARLADLERQGGIDDVARRHAVVDPARIRSDVLRDVGQERDHIVAHLALDLGDARHVEPCTRADRSERISGDDAPLGEHLARGQLDPEPRAVPRLLGPDGAHFGSRVALDHRKPALR